MWYRCNFGQTARPREHADSDTNLAELPGGSRRGPLKFGGLGRKGEAVRYQVRAAPCHRRLDWKLCRCIISMLQSTTPQLGARNAVELEPSPWQAREAASQKAERESHWIIASPTWMCSRNNLEWLISKYLSHRPTRLNTNCQARIVVREQDGLWRKTSLGAWG